MAEPRVTPVAVIGMACRLPGGIDSPELLWKALLRGDDLITEVPPDRWDCDEFYDPQPGVPGRTVCKWGGFLDNPADFDCEFFGIGEREAIAIDPQQRLLLETSWEAMEHAGLTQQTLAGSATGVFAGVTHGDYTMVAADAKQLEEPYGYLGNSFSMASGRVAYAMRLHGPAITVDTACSSGLTAVHMACRSLHEGESDVALAGGVALMLEPRKAAAGSALGMLSPTGRCRAFDVAADGFVSGEGCAVVVLKRLPDALADGDRILAVIRGTSANQDGHTVNIATPSQPAQVAAYRAALAAGGVDAATVGMVEAHGPGTPIGDPIEYASVSEVYGVDGPCALASVKTNFGHTQSTAGVLGLIKVVLALKHGVVPRNLHFTRLPDEIAGITTNLFVPEVTTPWPTNGRQVPRRAAVSSYGFSGTNVHAVVEQAPQTEAQPHAASTPPTGTPALFTLSASSADALRQTAQRLTDWIQQHADSLVLSDLAYTLARRRTHRSVRTAVIASSVDELIAGLGEVADGDTVYQPAVGQDDRGPVWLFSGQGSQWAAMGADLLTNESVFAATVAELEPLIAAESGFSVTEAMTAPETVTGIDRVQPTIFAMQVALAATMAAYGVRPGAVIGHSMGESAAAVVAGVLSAEDGVRVICRRSKLMATIAGSAAQFDKHGVQYGPAFTGLAVAYVAEDATATMLAEVALPGSIRSQQGLYAIHPALLDACFQSVGAHPDSQSVGSGLLVPLGVRRVRAYAPVRTARYCYTRVTKVELVGVEADIDVLDAHGTVLLAVCGLRIGTGVSERDKHNRVLNERLLTIEWHQRELPEMDPSGAGKWLLISDCAASDVTATRLADAFREHSAACTTMRWPLHDDQLAAADQLRDQVGSDEFSGVVVLTGSNTGTPHQGSADRGAEYVRRLVGIARELSDLPGAVPRMYVVTRGAQRVLADDCVNLEQGGLRGLLRTIGAEHPHLRATQIDVDEQTGVEQLARQLLATSEEDETAWRDNEWYVARLCPTPLRPQERRTIVADHQQSGMRLQIRTPGDMQTIELAAFHRVPPGPGQIEVAVRASSVNFADVLIAFGRYPSFEGHLPQLGTDFAGVVTAVGPGVTDHKVGDHVGGMSPNGCWGTFVTCDARLAATLPPGLGDAQAAAVTTAHATAWYGLHELARIRAGDTVLIHSGTGGVGQAAIAIARAAGAEIFATAGTPQRRELLRNMGIEHVYDSRSIEFAEQIRRDTNGRGVDVVLNSVTGAAQLAGLKLLAFRGRFVEIGKRDIYGDTKLGLFPFRRNLSFYAVDLGLLSATHPEELRDLLGTVYRLTAAGELPMPQSTHYPLVEAATAIRVMGNAEHTGKLVLHIPQTGKSLVTLPPEQAQVFRPDGSYIITGGLGGLGLFLAEKMAAVGCGRIVLNSRTQPTQKMRETIEAIAAMGSEVVVECGDIAQPGTAERLVATAVATGLPVRGVLHAAAVVEDATLANITDELLARDWAPKVHGAWELHEATSGQPLDWFCLFSSAAALTGSPGQSAYSAANSWLDAFAHWRQAQGLPATAIAWGAWSDIGQLGWWSASPARASALEESNYTAITPDEGAYAFEALLRHNRVYTGYAPVIGAPWLVAFAERSRFFEVFSSSNGSGTSKFRVELNELPRDEWPARLRQLVAEQVSLILRRTVDPDRPLPEYGLDSLGALELRTRIETETGIRLAPKNVSATVRGLADHLYEQLAPDDAPAAALSSQ
ncbi:SDR family NAD(P)-dependent oxidoreductase [Mycobacterium tuberculosis]|uniref:SDR family NAD(P)-dependent oxidoreductase n=1 Tax=Mycobacterium tuberculosis TaxID=1773 RepID=UPI0039C87388